MNIVKIDTAKVKADMRKMGVTGTKVSNAMGFSKHYVGWLLSAGEAKVETVNRLEDALFKSHGTYILGERGSEQKSLDGQAVEDILDAIDGLQRSIAKTNIILARIYASQTNSAEASL